MRTREIADICGVTEECIRQNAKKVGIEIGDRWHPHEYTEEELKKIQLELMKNRVNQGARIQKEEKVLTQLQLGDDSYQGGSIVKANCSNNSTVEKKDVVGENTKAVLELGALAKACLDSPEAWDQFKILGDRFQEQKKEISELEAKNQLLIEQKEAAEAETARIFQYNKNFHSQLYTATDLAKMLGTSANKVGRIAREQNLKQEPIYGKLGKIQLRNGRWCDVFYYNDDAKLVIENNL